MRQFCHMCRRETETVFLELSSGDIGNLCAICRTCRKGRPYVTRKEFEDWESLRPARAEGGNETEAIR